MAEGEKDFKMIKTIFWDNDGILVDTERLYYQATKEVLGRIGVKLSKEEYFRLFLVGNIGAWDYARDMGHTEEEVAIMRQERGEVYADLLKQETVLIDDVKPVLAKLWTDRHMGIVTSSRRNHFEIIHAKTDLLKYFQFVLTRDDYQKSKPHPEPYLLALEKSGSKKEECLIIEDSERGLKAANAANIACWVIPNDLTKSGDFSGAEKVLGSIAEVPDALENR